MKWRGMILAAMMACGAVAAAWGFDVSRLNPPKQPSTPLRIPPVLYFENNCSRCHGAQGSLYATISNRVLEDAALHRKVEEMARDNANAPLEGADLDAQVAMHRAIRGKEPFLAWTRLGGGQVGGEMINTKTVLARVKGEPVPVEATATRWTIKLPQGARAHDVELQAVAADGTTSTPLALKDAAFTHGKK